jgi:hypothetical protein
VARGHPGRFERLRGLAAVMRPNPAAPSTAKAGGTPARRECSHQEIESGNGSPMLAFEVVVSSQVDYVAIQ